MMPDMSFKADMPRSKALVCSSLGSGRSQLALLLEMGNGNASSKEAVKQVTVI
jgi:hypothetical protein